MLSGLIGLFLGLLGGVFLLVGLIPLLGWFNWFTSVPLAIIGLIVSRIGARGPSGSSLAGFASFVCGGVLIVALIRLFLGGGII